MKRLESTLLMIALTALLGCDGDALAALTGRIPPGAARDARARIDEARRRIEEDRARRNAAFAPVARGEVVPRADLGPCPHRAEEVERRVGGGYLVLSGLLSTTSRWAGRLGVQAGVLESLLTDERNPEGFELAVADLESALATPPPAFDYELVYLTYRSPERVGDDVFVQGEGEGTLFVYDRGQGRVICAGTARAVSSSSVRTTTLAGVDLGNVDLATDLTTRTALAAAEHLVVAGAPPGP